MSSATNEKSPKTTTVTNTVTTNIVQSRNVGADAVGIANAIGSQLNEGLKTIAAANRDYLQASAQGLATLGAGEVAHFSGGQLEVGPDGARSVSDAAQISQPLLIGAALLAAAFIFSRGK